MEVEKTKHAWPEGYVLRKLMKEGKVVAYFPSIAKIHKKIINYKPGSNHEPLFDIDFVDRVYEYKGYDVETSPAMESYYKKEVFLDYQKCKEQAYFLNAKLWLEASETFEGCEKQRLKELYKKHFKAAQKLGESLKRDILETVQILL